MDRTKRIRLGTHLLSILLNPVTTKQGVVSVQCMLAEIIQKMDHVVRINFYKYIFAAVFGCIFTILAIIFYTNILACLLCSVYAIVCWAGTWYLYKQRVDSYIPELLYWNFLWDIGNERLINHYNISISKQEAYSILDKLELKIK